MGNFNSLALTPTLSRKRARELRTNQTDAEAKIWTALRNRGLDGWKFRRQHPIGPYYADFACVEAMVIIEADGGQHNDDIDEKRTAWLTRQGWLVLRYWNHDIHANLAGILEISLSRLRERAGVRA
jgi:very-short-patch-repair endonuclease